MKPKQIVILLVIAVILGLVAYFMKRSETESWGGEAKTEEAALLLPESEFDASKVASMVFASTGRTVTLEKKEGGWMVKERHGYPANMDNLKSFLVSLTDCKVARTLALSEAQKAELKLTDEAGAVTVTLADASGNTLKKLVFGMNHTKEMDAGAMPQGMMMMGGGGPMPDGRFLGNGDQIVLVSETFHAVDSEPAYWLDKEFFKISDIKTAELLEGGKSQWKAARADKNADLALDVVVPEGKEVDTSKLGSVKTAFSWIHFNDVADPAAKPEDIGFDKTKTFVATDFDDFTYTLTFGAAVGGKRYLKLDKVEWNGATVREPGKDEKPEDKDKLDADFAKKVKENQEKAANYNTSLGKWIYEVGTYSLNNIDQTAEGFLKDKPKPAAEDKPAAEEKK